MVGGADDDGVDVGAGEQFLIMLVRRDVDIALPEAFRVPGLDILLGFLHAVGVQVADGDDAVVVELHHARHVVVTGDASGTDHADVDAVGGGRRALEDGRAGEKGRADGRRDGQAGAGGQGCFQEIPASQRCHIATVISFYVVLQIQIKEILHMLFAIKNEEYSSFAKYFLIFVP